MDEGVDETDLDPIEQIDDERLNLLVERIRARGGGGRGLGAKNDFEHKKAARSVEGECIGPFQTGNYVGKLDKTNGKGFQGKKYKEQGQK